MKQEITKSIEEAEKELSEKQIEKIINEMANEVCPNNSSELCASGRCSKLWECPFDIQTIEILAKKGYRKQVEAEWIPTMKYYVGLPIYKCSKCNRETETPKKDYYCPNCGAKMKGN